MCLASILIILSVSFERYYAVCYPLKMYSTESRSKALLLMAVMWVTSGLLTSPFLAITFTDTEFHYVDRVNVTICISPIYEEWHYGYIIARFVLVFVIPFCLLVFLYSRIIFKVREGRATDCLSVPLFLIAVTFVVELTMPVLICCCCCCCLCCW